jgi:branched-subunit amino acid transport protein
VAVLAFHPVCAQARHLLIQPPTFVRLATHLALHAHSRKIIVLVALRVYTFYHMFVIPIVQPVTTRTQETDSVPFVTQSVQLVIFQVLPAQLAQQMELTNHSLMVLHVLLLLPAPVVLTRSLALMFVQRATLPVRPVKILKITAQAVLSACTTFLIFVIPTVQPVTTRTQETGSVPFVTQSVQPVIFQVFPAQLVPQMELMNLS